MRKKLFVALMAVSLMMVVSPVMAEEIPSYNLEEIIIEADAVKVPTDTGEVNVKVVSPGKASTIPEILRFSAGIDVQQRAVSGDNQDGTVKLRGFDARRFIIMLNGRPINSAGVMGGQYVDWTTIPLNTVEKIQIIKGGKLASQGNTLGGTINIITKDKGVTGGEINLLTGSNGRYDYLFNYSGQADRLNFQVTANKTGAHAFLKNNDYDANQYGLRLNYDAGDKDHFAFGVNYTESKRGFIVANKPGTAGYDPAYPISDGEAIQAGGPANPNLGSYWKKFNTYYDFTYRHQQEKGFWKLDYWKNDEKRREVYTNAGINVDRTVITDKSDNIGLSGQQTSNGHTYNYGTEYKRLRYGNGWYDVGSGMALFPSQKVNLFGLYIDDSWQLDKRWSGYLGLRYDKFSGSADDAKATGMRDTDYSSFSPKVNFSFRNNADTTTFVSVNRLWRAPSMAEFYWWSTNYNSTSGIVVGKNTNLKPEQGYSYEIGMAHRFNDNYNTKVTAYYEDISDYINFQHMYPYSCYNISKAKVWGIEWENTYKLNSTSRILFNYTNQHTSKAGVNPIDKMGLTGELDYRPHHKISLSYLYDAKPWQVRYSANFVGEQTAMYVTSPMVSQQVKLGGYTLHNISFLRQLDESRSVSFYIDNIFDKQYAEQYGYPMSGRAYYVSFTNKI